MSKLKGDGKVTVNATEAEAVVVEISNWSINRTRGTNDEGTFDDGDWTKKSYAKAGWSGSISGFVALDDTTGQDIVEKAFEDAEVLKDMRFYLNHTTTPEAKVDYFTPDIASDPDAGVLITAHNVTKNQANKTAEVSISFEGTGPLKKMNDTIPAG